MLQYRHFCLPREATESLEETLRKSGASTTVIKDRLSDTTLAQSNILTADNEMCKIQLNLDL